MFFECDNLHNRYIGLLVGEFYYHNNHTLPLETSTVIKFIYFFHGVEINTIYCNTRLHLANGLCIHLYYHIEPHFICYIVNDNVDPI